MPLVQKSAPAIATKGAEKQQAVEGWKAALVQEWRRRCSTDSKSIAQPATNILTSKEEEFVALVDTMLSGQFEAATKRTQPTTPLRDTTPRSMLDASALAASSSHNPREIVGWRPRAKPVSPFRSRL